VTGGDRLVISGGTVVTPGGPLRADLVIGGERILAVTAPGAAPAGDGILEASGCLVLPGGVDPHCHVMADVTAATRAGALGGTTTALSFTNPEPGEDAADCLRRRRAELAGAAAVDVGLHAMLYRPDQVSRAELSAIRQAGSSAVKIFLAYQELGIAWSGRGLLALLSTAPEFGLLVQVHCEDGEVIEGLVAAAVAAGRRGPRLFAQTRPPGAEVSAVSRVLETAAIAGAACYLTHLSCSSSLDLVRAARRSGRRGVHAEACLHHLLLDDGCYRRDDAERYLVAPPLRPAADRDALWQGLADGTIDTVGSDHSQERSQTRGELAPDGQGYRYGIAGIGPRLPLLLSEGLARGIPVRRVAEAAAANPAAIFGHYPRKGALAPGSDADVVIWDPAPETTLEVSTFGDGTGDSVYAGRRVRGQVRDVLLRGRPVVRDGRYCADGPAGAYLPAPAA
jgi:dihydropyrimidinase